MSDVTDMLRDGTLCWDCGTRLAEDTGPGYRRVCNACAKRRRAADKARKEAARRTRCEPDRR